MDESEKVRRLIERLLGAKEARMQEQKIQESGQGNCKNASRRES